MECNSLIEEQTTHKIRVGLNIPSTEVRYEETTEENIATPHKKSWLDKFTNRKDFSNSSKNEYIITRSDHNNLKVSLDPSPPYLLSLLERQAVFFKSRLLFSVMLPNELALVSLCERSKHFDDKNKVTIIIQVEEDFSHLISERILKELPWLVEDPL